MAVEKELSKRDAFRSRMRASYPDLDIDNEDAYYDQVGRDYDELENSRKSAANLKENLKKSPLLRDMVLAGQGKENFDPIEHLAETRGLDLEALVNDKEYVKKIAAAGADTRKKQAQGEEIKKAQQENLPGSIEACITKGEEMGLSDDQIQDAIGKMFGMANDLVYGKIDISLFEMVAKGANYDTAVEQAKQEGIQQGVETKVTDRLKKMPAQAESVQGAQAPVKEPAQMPQKKRNPFVED